ncbi:hypothetical protein ABB37_01640 [Leptomonas pyrrhocoris]|uniref:Uncharacterized protein n=1 Tax=Leptomonas pyrrhocoris TaxID=157538 RepID=A0A0M9G9D5_LEPPY|nr:hypothetical protein ABB37_01640 [Leptomonas pyrrhocoris]KPA85306.1 hypothetical protein ABB37_01640 [Leptomonas pyrrhocoris]|eukprot:XP_015663745.1 hypothetical protein ABB37_01640 [Leptomonas pyrrhocoris]
MYSPPFADGATQAWGPASSPSPAAAVGRHRTPRDDAPAYDPLLWQRTDNAYISTLAAHVMTHQPPPAPGCGPAERGKPTKLSLQKFLSSSWAQSPEEEAAARLSKFHGVYNRVPMTMIGRLLQFVSAKLFPWWHEGVSPTDVASLSTNELIHLMQLALAAGEVERSAMLARELSRRKLALQMHAFPTRLPGETDFDVRSVRSAAPPAPASPLPQPVGAADDRGFLPRHEQRQQQESGWRINHGVTPVRATSWSQQRGDYGAYLHQDDVKVSGPIGAERTASWGGGTAQRPPSPSPTRLSVSTETSQYVSDVGVSSLRGSAGDSVWRNDSRWGSQWGPSPP